MNRTEIETLVRQKLFEIAPDLEGEPIDPNVEIRAQYDFDSMDFLHFVVALHKATGVEIPETDYPKLANLNGCIDYLTSATNR